MSRTDAEWRALLGRRAYRVLRRARTERPWTGALLHEQRSGRYLCRACGRELFSSAAKFDSRTGWPSFYEPAAADAVDLREERRLLMSATEVRCARCGSHLGHVFDDAHETPSGLRYCMNSVALTFEPRDP